MADLPPRAYQDPMCIWVELGWEKPTAGVVEEASGSVHVEAGEARAVEEVAGWGADAQRQGARARRSPPQEETASRASEECPGGHRGYPHSQRRWSATISPDGAPSHVPLWRRWNPFRPGCHGRIGGDEEAVPQLVVAHVDLPGYDGACRRRNPGGSGGGCRGPVALRLRLPTVHACLVVTPTVGCLIQWIQSGYPMEGATQVPQPPGPAVGTLVACAVVSEGVGSAPEWVARCLPADRRGKMSRRGGHGAPLRLVGDRVRWTLVAVTVCP